MSISNGFAFSPWAPHDDRRHSYQQALQRGDYTGAAVVADALPPGVRSHPRVALDRARARMRQGQMGLGHAALKEADLRNATIADCCLLSLESACLRVFREVALPESLQDATTVLAASDSDLSPADRAEAERVYIRLLLIAATYRVLSTAEGHQARDRLPAIADRLEAADRFDEALAARFTWAQKLARQASGLGPRRGEAARRTRPEPPPR